MTRYLSVLLLCLWLIGSACSSTDSDVLPTDDAQDETSTVALAEHIIFVAVEGDSALAAIHGETGALLAVVDLSVEEHGAKTLFAAHNVQVDPSGRTAWLTAMPIADDGGHIHGDGSDQLVGVDVATLAVTARITLGPGLHAAHVVIFESTAYVTASDADQVLVVDLVGQKVQRILSLPQGSYPHGARLSSDGQTLVVAGMAEGAGALFVVETESGQVTRYPLPGRAVQTAISPTEATAFATIYDTRQVARLDLFSKKLTLFDLPAQSAGPVQLYPAPDGRSLWIADQGMLSDHPTGNKLIQLDTSTGEALRVVAVDPGPHGVVLDHLGEKAWVTTLVNGTVQAIDTQSGAVLSTTPIGNKPNGINFRHTNGAMP
jgi:DNA-binding beta-propeller fold protein YncE